MEISKMLTLSTAHITRETALWIDENMYADFPIFPKDDYGWFMYVSEDIFDREDECEVPEDLIRCLLFADANDCQWLCLDGDGEVLEELETFEW